MNYRYSIKDKLNLLTAREYKRLRKEIPKALGKTVRTFDRYCNIEINEFADIPVQDLDIIAAFLNCTADDLKNYTIADYQIQHSIIHKRSS